MVLTSVVSSGMERLITEKKMNLACSVSRSRRNGYLWCDRVHADLRPKGIRRRRLAPRVSVIRRKPSTYHLWHRARECKSMFFSVFLVLKRPPFMFYVRVSVSVVILWPFLSTFNACFDRWNQIDSLNHHKWQYFNVVRRNANVNSHYLHGLVQMFKYAIIWQHYRPSVLHSILCMDAVYSIA